jgi:hypothetical protein
MRGGIVRLIDADRLRKIFEDGECPCKLQYTLLGIVDVQPTAFDVDKVINELKRDKFIESECVLSDIHQGYNAGLNRAIEIVKGGGAE